jgi:SAM-dependent methyltransferase
MSSSRTRSFFSRVASRYDDLRPADANWQEVAATLFREGDLAGRRVLEVGCGTGRLTAAFAERGVRVWGVDPSSQMLEVARSRAPRGVGFKLGRAEELPFKDGWFDRAVAQLVIHLLDRPRAFAELRRVLVPDGKAVIATFDPSHFGDYWLNRFFPSLEAIDRARFPHAGELSEELQAAGFPAVRTVRLSQRASLDRATALEKVRNRWISTLNLIGEDEFRSGLERAERELPAKFDYALEWLIAVAGPPS